MVEQTTGSTHSEIVYSPTGAKLSLMNGTALLKAFVPLPGGATAVYTASGLTYYRHTDHLGSSRFASTSTQTLYSDTAYSPFGEPYATSGALDDSFTGQNQDTMSGLYDFTYREYDPYQSRWSSPDPTGLVAVNPAVPQSWNRYVYVSNDPLGLVDRGGLVCNYYADDGGTVESQDFNSNPDECMINGGVWFPDVSNYQSQCDPGVICVTSILNPQPPSDPTVMVGGYPLLGFGMGPGPGCPVSTTPTLLVNASATVPLKSAGAALGEEVGGPVGAFFGGKLGNMFGIGFSLSMVPSTKSYYLGPTVAFGPSGGGGFNVSFSAVPPGQSANAIANGYSTSVTTQSKLLNGVSFTASPGNPIVAGYSIGLRSVITWAASWGFCLSGCC